MKFYLAGPFVSLKVATGKVYSDWRDCIIEGVSNHTFSDPRKNNQSCPAMFTQQDLEGVVNSDGIFVYRPTKGEAIGAAWEQGIALGASYTGKKIPAIFVDEHPFPFPLLAASAKRTFTRLDAAIFYMNKLESWDKEFEAICSYMEWETKMLRGEL